MEKKISELEEQDKRRCDDERRDRRQERLDHHRTLMQQSVQKMKDMTINWKATQEVKKERRIRDLQLELSQLKKEELQKLHTKQIHENDEQLGIIEFERNMKRLGVGNDGTESRLAISYETYDAYESRIKSLSHKKFPTNEEINNFVSQLKERTTNKRAARYEKARRRRRALVDQANSLKYSDSIEAEPMPV